jgi:opacity protein-like surface antigen
LAFPAENACHLLPNQGKSQLTSRPRFLIVMPFEFWGETTFMGRLRWGKGIIWLALLGVVGAAPLSAGEFDYERFNQEWAVRAAYGKSIRKAEVNLYTLLPRWGIFLVRPCQPCLAGLGISVVFEGIISIADADNTGWEGGLSPLLKLSFPLGNRALLFLEGGAGIIWENFKSVTVTRTFNFTPQFGGGVDIALTRDWALTLAYRFRHSSNASIYKENSDLNVNLFQVGLTYYR